MSIVDLYTSGKHTKNVAHFASLVSLANINGSIEEKEMNLLEKLARKLDITATEFEDVITNQKKFTVEASNSYEHRLERLFDFFSIINSDSLIDEIEVGMIKRYAIGIGFDSDTADKLIKRSIAIFEGRINFEEYKSLL